MNRWAGGAPKQFVCVRQTGETCHGISGFHVSDRNAIDGWFPFSSLGTVRMFYLQ